MLSLHRRIPTNSFNRLFKNTHGVKAYPHATHIGELGVSVNVHLDDTVSDGSANLLFGGPRTSMEDEEPSVHDMLFSLEAIE